MYSVCYIFSTYQDFVNYAQYLLNTSLMKSHDDHRDGEVVSRQVIAVTLKLNAHHTIR